MKKPKVSKEVSQPIVLTLKSANQTLEVTGDTVLDCFNKLSQKINPLNVKYLSWVGITANNKTVNRMYNIPRLKRLLSNRLTQEITAKLYNSGVGL